MVFIKHQNKMNGRTDDGIKAGDNKLRQSEGNSGKRSGHHCVSRRTLCQAVGGRSGLGIGNCCAMAREHVRGCPPTAAEVAQFLRVHSEVII